MLGLLSGVSLAESFRRHNISEDGKKIVQMKVAAEEQSDRPAVPTQPSYKKLCSGLNGSCFVQRGSHWNYLLFTDAIPIQSEGACIILPGIPYE